MSRIDRYTCEQVFQLLEDYLDKELAPTEVERVNAHLAICEACAAEYAFQADVIKSVRERVQRISVSESLRNRLSAALKQAEEAGN